MLVRDIQFRSFFSDWPLRERVKFALAVVLGTVVDFSLKELHFWPEDGEKLRIQLEAQRERGADGAKG